MNHTRTRSRLSSQPPDKRPAVRAERRFLRSRWYEAVRYVDTESQIFHLIDRRFLEYRN